MTLSIDLGFTAVDFPELRSTVSTARGPIGDRGYAAGYAEGLRRAADELAARRAVADREQKAVLDRIRDQGALQLSALRTATDSIARVAAPVLEESVDALTAAAVRLAEAIVGYQLSDEPLSARAALQRCLDARTDGLDIEIHMHPADIQLLEPLSLDAAHTALVPDSTLARGDAVGRFAGGMIDARISTALAEAVAALWVRGPHQSSAVSGRGAS